MTCKFCEAMKVNRQCDKIDQSPSELTYGKYIHFRDDDEENVLNDLVGCKYGYDSQGRDIYDLTDAEWDALYKSIPWVKCIAVYITA